MEIERKYLIHELPSGIFEKYPGRRLIQGYLCREPVVRVRQDADRFELTYKSGGLMAREEVNLPLTQEAFETLLAKTDGRIIRKMRYCIPYGPHTIELDVFQGDLEGLVLAEVEFDSVDAANAFTPPDWFGEDVTFDGRYHNSVLSAEGN